MLQTAGNGGIADAQYELGNAYQDGEGIALNRAEALKWWREAAARGHPQAQYLYGEAQLYGRDLPENRSAAKVLLNRAASEGVSLADAELTKMAWCEQLLARAEQNDAEIWHSIGSAYFNSVGVAQDSTAAANWWHKAVAAGHPPAQVALAKLYLNGDGVEKDIEHGKAWLSRAASAGDNSALEELKRIGAISE
jgi:TPR repeat protein